MRRRTSGMEIIFSIPFYLPGGRTCGIDKCKRFSPVYSSQDGRGEIYLYGDKGTSFQNRRDPGKKNLFI